MVSRIKRATDKSRLGSLSKRRPAPAVARAGGEL